MTPSCARTGRAGRAAPLQALLARAASALEVDAAEFIIFARPLWTPNHRYQRNLGPPTSS